MSRRIVLALFATVVSLLFATPALAGDWPQTVVGSWNIVGNLAPGTLHIATQGTGEGCLPITGSIYVMNRIEGFYCPSSGRISFLRKTTSNVSFQVWTGNLSQAVPGLPVYMSGILASEDFALGGDVGEYNFFGTKQ